MRIAADFLFALIKAVPYKIHTALSDEFISPIRPAGPGPRLKFGKCSPTGSCSERVNRTIKDRDDEAFLL